MRIVFVSWRDLAHPQAGGSEVVLDHLDAGLQARGHEITLLSGGPVTPRFLVLGRLVGTRDRAVDEFETVLRDTVAP